MQKRLYFVLGMVTSAILLYLAFKKSFVELAQFRASQAGLRELNAHEAEERAARWAMLTPEQKIRIEMMKQEYRMQALEELDEQEAKKQHGKKKNDD